MKILLAYDGSDHSDSALDGLAIAGLPPVGTVRILSVAEARLKRPDRVAIRQAEIMARIGEDRFKRLFPGWKTAISARSGTPAREILKVADEWKPDLLVVGSGASRPWRGYWLGSVALRVALHAGCTVRIGRADRKGALQKTRILIAYDGSAQSDSALAEAASRDWPAGAIFRLITVLDSCLPASLMLVPGRKGQGYDWIESRQLESLARLRSENRTATRVLRMGEPKRILLREITRWKADLVFLGDKGLGAWKRFLFGEVAFAVAASAPCSIELVRA